MMSQIGLYLIVFICVWLTFKKGIYEKFINPTIELNASSLSSKLVLITGCDSGFGHELAIALYKLGFSVLSTCLTREGKQELRAKIKKIAAKDKNQSFHCLIVDVTKDEDVDRLKAYVIKACAELNLWSIVNNAGIMKTGEFDLMTMNDFEQVMNVNFFGCIRVIKSLVHTLRKTEHARIINVVSSGVLNPMYAYSAYLCSKSALQTLSIVLRAEFSSFNVYVSSIMPGANNTNILNTEKNLKLFQERMKNLNDDILDEYGTEYFTQSANKCIMGTKMVTPKKLDAVIDAMVDAVIRQRPYKRYIVGYDAHFQYFLSFLPFFIQEFVISTPLKPWVYPKRMCRQNEKQS